MINTEWEQLLTERGAVISGQRVQHFGQPDTERAAMVHESILTDLGHYGVIAVEGEDAATFLQNQLTNDVQLLEAGDSQLSGYCTPKGRLLTVFRLFADDNRFYLRMPAGLIEPVVKRLQMFVLMSKVRLTPLDDSLQRIGVAGPDAGPALKPHFDGIPETVNSVTADDDCRVIKVPGETRYEIYAPPERTAELWRHLETRLTPVGADAWPLLDILEGIPTVYPETVEHFIPQMLNLELIGGVSFKKGCFPGQEVVARMHYRGQTKRRMFRVAIDGDTPPAPGTLVRTADTEKPREVGELVDARVHPDGGCQGLAVLQLANREQKLVLEGDGGELKVLDLPYEVPA